MIIESWNVVSKIVIVGRAEVRKLKRGFSIRVLCKEVSCGRSVSICLTDEGIVYSFGKNKYGQLGIGNSKNGTQSNSPQIIFRMVADPRS